MVLKKKQRLTSTSVSRYKGFPLYQLIVQLSTARTAGQPASFALTLATCTTHVTSILGVKFPEKHSQPISISNVLIGSSSHFSNIYSRDYDLHLRRWYR